MAASTAAFAAAVISLFLPVSAALAAFATASACFLASSFCAAARSWSALSAASASFLSACAAQAPIRWASVSASALPSPWTITANESSACPCARERRAAGANVPDETVPVPLLAFAGSEAQKLRTTAARAALINVAPARRPPLPQRALPRESPPREPLPQRALPRSPCRSPCLFTFSPFSAPERGPQFRNPPERRLEQEQTPHP